MKLNFKVNQMSLLDKHKHKRNYLSTEKSKICLSKSTSRSSFFAEKAKVDRASFHSSAFLRKPTPEAHASVFDDSLAMAPVWESQKKSETGAAFSKIVESLTAKEILESHKPRIVSIPENKTVYEALQKMHSEDVGCIIVEKLNNQGFGIFTETDYVRKIALRGLSSKTTELIQVMNSNVTTVYPNTNIEQMSSLMMQDGIHHLPVVQIVGDPKNQKLSPIGVISARDVATHLVKAVEASKDISLDGTVQHVFDKLGRQSSQDVWMKDDDTVFSAIQKMTKNEIGAILINSSMNMTGIFTERDYLFKIILKGRSSRNTKLKDVMTQKVIFVNPETPTRDCLTLASKKKIRHIPIVSLLGEQINAEQIVGMVTVNDIISFLMLQLERKKLKQDSPDIDL